MILWCIQPVEVYTSLQEQKTLYVDPAFWDEWFKDNQAWIRAYEWMKERMACRLPEYAGHYPWWAWTDECRPDLRWARHHCRGRHVRLKLDVPDQHVLLSNFDAWHAVLNNMPLTDTEAEDDEIFRGIEHLRGNEEFERSMRASWERIFDLEGLKDHWAYPTSYVQACFEKLHLEYVRNVRFFEGVSRAN